jgi:protocatechuate 3,4-dioxygenase beta subunit
MIIETTEDVTAAALAAMGRSQDARVRTIVTSLVMHLHAFATEVKLTEQEFEYGIAFLNRIGQATNDVHNEAVLFSDVIGFSTLVCLMNNGAGGATEPAAALLGPFWRANAPRMENGDSIVRSPTPGPPLFVEGRIVDPEGRPLVGVLVDVWHSSPSGMYENQDEAQADMNLRGVFTTDADGLFRFRSVKPAGYPVPTDGPSGDLLHQQSRHPYRPAHLHVLAHRDGLKTLVTQVFVDHDQYLESDVVFGVTRALVGDFRKGTGTPPAPDIAGDWYTLKHTFVMVPGPSILPHPPIK